MRRLFVLSLTLLSGLTACQQSAGPGDSTLQTAQAPGNALPSEPDRNYLLNARGGYVLSDPPPGVEIRFGSKLVRRVGWQNAASPSTTGPVQESD